MGINEIENTKIIKKIKQNLFLKISTKLINLYILKLLNWS